MPAKNILAANTGGTASDGKETAPSAVARITVSPDAPVAQATAAIVIKPPSANKRPTTSTVKTAPLAAATLPPIESYKAKSGNQNGGSIVPRVGDKATPVFISYQSAFTESVLKIKRAMEERGIPCWMATENLVGNVQDAIGEALMIAPAIIICFSH